MSKWSSSVATKMLCDPGWLTSIHPFIDKSIDGTGGTLDNRWQMKYLPSSCQVKKRRLYCWPGHPSFWVEQPLEFCNPAHRPLIGWFVFAVVPRTCTFICSITCTFTHSAFPELQVWRKEAILCKEAVIIQEGFKNINLKNILRIAGCKEMTAYFKTTNESKG